MKKFLGILGTLSIGVGVVGTGTVFGVTNTTQKIQGLTTLATNNTQTLITLAANDEQSTVDWIALNNLFDLGFTASNEYKPWVETYNNSWRDFGWKTIFPEGDVNAMRLVQLVTTAYNDVNFQPLEDILVKGMDVFDYITNIEKHLTDKVEVLATLITNLINEMNLSPIPFAESLMTQLNSISNIMRFLKNQELSLMLPIFKTQIQNVLGMSLEELGQKYTAAFKGGLLAISITNDVLKTFKDSLPEVIFNYLMNNIKSVSTSMVDVDTNHNGVELYFQAYVIPKGFRAH